MVWCLSKLDSIYMRPERVAIQLLHASLKTRTRSQPWKNWCKASQSEKKCFRSTKRFSRFETGVVPGEGLAPCSPWRGDQLGRLGDREVGLGVTSPRAPGIQIWGAALPGRLRRFLWSASSPSDHSLSDSHFTVLCWFGLFVRGKVLDEPFSCIIGKSMLSRRCIFLGRVELPLPLMNFLPSPGSKIPTSYPKSYLK